MTRILIFGDSIAFGKGKNKTQGWFGILEKKYKTNSIQIFNLSIPGENTNSLLEHIKTEIDARIKYMHKNEKIIIIISIGVNDSRLIENKFQIDEKKFKSNLKKISKILSKYTENIYFLQILPVNEKKINNINFKYYNNRIDKYNNILKEQKLNLIEFNNLIIKKNYNALFEDGLHPTKKTYFKLFLIIEKEIFKFFD